MHPTPYLNYVQMEGIIQQELDDIEDDAGAYTDEEM